MGNTCPGGTRPRPRPESKHRPTPEEPVDMHIIDSPPREQPLPPVPSKKRVRALYNFDAISEDDLSFKKGDIMEIDEATSETDDWWLGIHLKSKKRGYIPSNYVIIDDSSPQAQDWWFEYDRKESNKMLLLAGNPRGTFLIRESTDKETYVLSVRDSNEYDGDPCVKHYKIQKMDNGQGFYISPKTILPSLFDVISYYKENSDGLCCRLKSPCPRIRPVVQFRDLEISRDKVQLSAKIGAGCFGEVWKGKLLKVVDVAVKTLKPGTMSSKEFLDEARLMHRLTHQRLVQLLAVVSANQPFYIITELMINGALLDFLRSDKGKRLKFSTLIDMNAQISEGMSYLESVNFIHRDLRAANILVGQHLDVKVADFGLARILDKDDAYKAQEKTKFPIKWTAPEAANRKQFSVKSDVWSFGVLMYEIITLGKIPYPGMTGHEVLARLEGGFRMPKPINGPNEVPDSYYDMMLNCWHTEPEQRPTFESLYNFFDDFFINIEPSYREMDDFM